MLKPRPRSHRGLWRNQDGDIVDAAEDIRFRRDWDIRYRTVGNGGVEISARFTVGGESTFNIGVDVPDGLALVIWFRDLVLPEGSYEIDVVNAEWDTDSGDAMVISNLDDRESEDVQSAIRTGVTITGTETIRSSVNFDAGSQAGNARPPGSPSVDNAFRIITKPTVLKLSKQDSGDAECSALYLAWETDAEAD